MSDDVVIKADGIYKDFILPHERVGSVKGIFTGMFKNTRVRKEKQHALKNISFEIKRGEFFGIVGRNGSGKSTLLKILAGIYQPTRGSVMTNGKLVPFIELGVGFNPELTGKDNVYLNGALLGFSSTEVDEMYDEIVGFAELDRFMDQKLKNYSSGMQVRLAFSMAIRSKAEILLLDEVLAVGDADFQRKCFEYFDKIKLENTTIIFISHDMNAVNEYCDRAMLIDNNEIIAIGSTADVTENYLKLFSSNVTKNNSLTSKRWGDEAAAITGVDAKFENNKIKIEAEVIGRTSIESPNIGFRLRDLSGRELIGTNTRLENIKIKKLPLNKKTVVKWEFENFLKQGEYNIDISIIYRHDTVVADWWDGAAVISIKRDHHSPYMIDPVYKTVIKY